MQPSLGVFCNHSTPSSGHSFHPPPARPHCVTRCIPPPPTPTLPQPHRSFSSGPLHHLVPAKDCYPTPLPRAHTNHRAQQGQPFGRTRVRASAASVPRRRSLSQGRVRPRSLSRGIGRVVLSRGVARRRSLSRGRARAASVLRRHSCGSAKRHQSCGSLCPKASVAWFCGRRVGGAPLERPCEWKRGCAALVCYCTCCASRCSVPRRL